jgi:hypothetical protein
MLKPSVGRKSTKGQLAEADAPTRFERIARLGFICRRWTTHKRSVQRTLFGERQSTNMFAHIFGDFVGLIKRRPCRELKTQCAAQSWHVAGQLLGHNPWRSAYKVHCNKSELCPPRSY